MKHCWNVSTSPRSPAKLRPEIEALAAFDGHVNDAHFQERFTEVLKGLGEFQGQGSENNESFSARDRIAPMQTYGFVYIDDDTKIVHITPAGRALIDAASEITRQEIWVRQMLKWQFPAPQHCNAQYTQDVGMFGRQGFNVKPFLVALEMIKRCSGLAKEEIAMFVLTKIDMDMRDLARRCNLVEEYRRIRDSLPAGRPRKEFKEKAVAMIYTERNAAFKPSRTVSAASAMDYADAFFRLLRMTGLVTPRKNRVAIAQERASDVEALLAKAWPFRDDWDDQEAFYDYFGSATNPKLPWEDIGKLRARVHDLQQRVEGILKTATFAVPMAAASRIPTATEIDAASQGMLNDQYEALTGVFKDLQKTSMLGEIRTPSGMLAVSEFFDNITKKIEVFDPPVQLEWNCWRAFLAIDHTDVVEGNFTMDSNLQPLTRAPGNGPDGVACFSSFDVIFEPTLKTGPKQWNDESEPIYRHAVLYTNAVRDRGDDRDVYTWAVAPKIEPSLAAYFLNAAKGLLPIPGMREPPLIVPITIAQMQQMLAGASRTHGLRPDEIWVMLEGIGERAREIDPGDNVSYMEAIQAAIDSMLAEALEERGNIQAA